MAVPVAREHGPGVRGRRREGRRRHVWTGSQKPHFVRDGVAQLARAAAGESARASGSRARLVRPQRRRRRRARCRVALEAHRPPGARAGHARTKARAGIPKGPACVYRGAPGWTRGQRDRATTSSRKGFSRQHITTNESDPRDTPGRPARSACRASRDIGLRRRRPSLRLRQQADARGRRSAPLLERARRCARRTCATRSARRSHFASESVHRRGRRRRRRRSGRVPAAAT